MSNEKQSSVEWLFSQLPDEFTTTKIGFDMLKQAKAMHEDEIMAAWFDGVGSWGDERGYYEETFGEQEP